jgi:hypothetical protein
MPHLVMHNRGLEYLMLSRRMELQKTLSIEHFFGTSAVHVYGKSLSSCQVSRVLVAKHKDKAPDGWAVGQASRVAVLDPVARQSRTWSLLCTEVPVPGKSRLSYVSTKCNEEGHLPT